MDANAHKVVDFLSAILNEVDELDTKDLHQQCILVKQLLEDNNFEEESSLAKSFNNCIYYINQFYHSQDNRNTVSGANLDEARIMVKKKINAIIQYVTSLGLPPSLTGTTPSQNDSSVIINNQLSQTQNQEQSQTMVFEALIKALRDDMSGKQLTELSDIAKSDEEVAVKKERFVEKIKSFGSDVASNVLAGLITNPEVWKNLQNVL